MNIAQPTNILITGASSGIGAALARDYAAPGIRLVLGGRDRTRLGHVAQDCRARGAEVETGTVDVTAKDEMARWIADAFAHGPIDLIIANAGISGGTGGNGEDAESSESRDQVESIFAVNVGGVLNTVYPAIEQMRKRKGVPVRGQIVVMSSLAGFRGLPGAPAYSASKACVRSLGEGLRGSLARQGLRVSVICPGFVKSPMTDINPYPMPFLMPVEKAARIIRRGLARNRARIAFPWRLWAMVWLMSALPVGLTDPLFSRMPEKPATPPAP